MTNAALVAAEAFKLGVSVDHVSNEREVWACACPTRWPDTDTSTQKLGRMVEMFALAQRFPAGFTFDIDAPRGTAWMLTMRWRRGVDVAAVAAWFAEFERVDRDLNAVGIQASVARAEKCERCGAPRSLSRLELAYTLCDTCLARARED